MVFHSYYEPALKHIRNEIAPTDDFKLYAKIYTTLDNRLILIAMREMIRKMNGLYHEQF
mgnify:CR=1 FL=1